MNFNDPYGDAEKQMKTSTEKHPMEEMENRRRRKECLDRAVAACGPGSRPDEVLDMARKFEQFVLGQSDTPSMKETSNG